jgi:hypothetical protein
MPIVSAMTSAEWSDVTVAMRRRALLSSHVEMLGSCDALAPRLQTSSNRAAKHFLTAKQF